MMSTPISRRDFLRLSALASLSLALGATSLPLSALAAPAPGPSASGARLGPGCLIQSSFGRLGNFEAVVLEGDQLVHYFYVNDIPDLRWQRGAVITNGVSGPGCLIESSFGKSSSRPGNFELIVLQGNELLHYYKDNGAAQNPWLRVGGPPISTRATGPACLIESSFGKSSTRPGNFELIALEGSELVHYFKDNSSLSNPWRRTGYAPISTRATGPACLIESSFGRTAGRPGNFELIVPEGTELVHYFKDNSSLNNPWRRGQTITTAALGPGILIQSNQGVGADKNFEVLVQESFGSVVHYTHPNQDVNLPWARRHIVMASGPWPVKLSRTRRVGQLTGEASEWNRTETLAGLRGTDLGVSFEHKGAVYFLFGDTWRTSWQPACGDKNDDLDAVASTTDRAAYDGLKLTFNGEIVGREGDRWKVKSLPPRLFEGGQPVGQGGFEVPMEGFSHEGKMWVFFTNGTRHFAIRRHPNGSGTIDADVMSRSLLAVSTDEGHDGYSFDVQYEFSRDKFINVSVDRANARAHGIAEDGDVLFIWGSGRYRSSDVCLAYLPLNRVHDRGAIRYYAGRWRGLPIWSRNEADAVPLFPAGCVGELSCRWNRYLNRWLLMFNGDPPRGIQGYLAEWPWGPYNDVRLVFDPADGYGQFMHAPGRDSVNDRMFGCDRAGEYGGEYGPYQITRYTTGVTGMYTKVYFTLSSWNPYQVHLMSAVIPVEGDSLVPVTRFVDRAATATLKFARLAQGLAEAGAASEIHWELPRQGSLDYPDHVEWAEYESAETLRTEVLLRFRQVLGQLSDPARLLEVYAHLAVDLVELGGGLPDDQPDTEWQMEQARQALDEGGPDRLLELTQARLAQPDLFGCEGCSGESR